MTWARIVYGQRSQCASPAAPLLILHGLFGSSRNWQTIGAALATRLARPLIVFDLPNHGKSAQASMTWDSLTMQLRNELDRIQKEPTLSLLPSHKPIVMGHSLGGQVIMQALFRQPDLPIDRLILVDIGPAPVNFASTPMNRYLEVMMEIEQMHLSSRKEAMNHFRKRLPETSEAILQFIFTNWGRKLPIGSDATVDRSRKETGENFMIPLGTLRESMLTLSKTQKYPAAPLTLPTLFIRGGRSDYITDADMPLIKRCFSCHQVVTIPQSGHWPHYEAPDDFMDVLANTIR